MIAAIFFVAILATLGVALVALFRRGDPTRMAKALTWRVGLSVALFLLLMVGYWLGLFQPGKL